MRNRRLVRKASATLILGFALMAIAAAQSARASSSSTVCYIFCHWDCPTAEQQDTDCEAACAGTISSGCGDTPCPWGERTHTHNCVYPT